MRTAGQPAARSSTPCPRSVRAEHGLDRSRFRTAGDPPSRGPRRATPPRGTAAGLGRGARRATHARTAATGGRGEPGPAAAAPRRAGWPTPSSARLPFVAHRRASWRWACRSPTISVARIRCTACCRARSARARRSSRCARCSRSSTPEAQAALLAPTEVLAAQHARSIEAMLGELAQAGRFGSADRGDPDRSADRLDARRRPSPSPTRRGVRRGRHRHRHTRPDPEDGAVRRPRAWWWSTSSTASASSSAMRCGPKQSTPPHLLVMTATPDPAHSGDDGVRGPGHIHAVRAAGRSVTYLDHRGAGR